MSGVSFVHPWVFLALPLAPLAFAAWWYGSRRGRARERMLTRTHGAGPPYFAVTVLALAAVAAVVAGAQPRWGTRASHIPRNGADLVIVMDISRSMDAQDVPPGRLQVAKTAAKATVDRLGGDRVALVVFAGDARIRFPLTTDLVAANRVIDTLETGVVYVVGGTSAAGGLDVALSVFGKEKASGRVILLLTDGDDLGGDPAETALKVKASGASLLVAGVGTPDGATIPVVDLSTRKVVNKIGSDGSPIVSKLNEPFLRALAAASGGRYIGAEPSAIPGAVDGRLRALASQQLDERPTNLPIERYQWFAGAALALLVLASVAERFRVSLPSRHTVAFAALLLILLPGCATATYEANERGRDALAHGDASTAIDAFLEAQVGHPDDARISLNLAAAYDAGGRYDEAIIAARRALSSNSASIRTAAYASIGHHQFAAGRYGDSLSAFTQALLADPSNESARHDYEVVHALIHPAPPTDQTQPDNPNSGASPTSAAPGAGTPPPNAPPVAGSGSPTPGASPSSGGPGGTPTPGPGRPTSTDQIDKQLSEIDSQVNRLVQEAGDTPTAAQALDILRLLAERSRIATLRDGLAGGGNPRDY
jgi:Ca-activated chloride channel family protein